MAKKVLFFISILIFAGATFFFLMGDVFSNTTMPEVQEETELPSVFKPDLEPIYSQPVRIYSPDIALDVELVEVGVEEDGALEAPDDWYVGGWYKKSSKAGEVGNIVVSGHYDNDSGGSAAFWNLKNLEVGAKVYLVDAYGRTFGYQVTEVFYLDISDPNRLHIFENDHQRHVLTLITCGGLWDASKGTYNKRLVIKALEV